MTKSDLDCSFSLPAGGVDSKQEPCLRKGLRKSCIHSFSAFSGCAFHVPSTETTVMSKTDTAHVVMDFIF